MKKIMIFVITIILFAAILTEVNSQSRYDKSPVYKRDNRYDKYDKHDRRDKQYNDGYDRHDRRGHWSVDRVWVEPVYRKKWNPGHYNHRGRWVSGRYEHFIIREGYWETKRIWIHD